MNWQILHGSSGLRATNLYTPAVVDEATNHVGCKGEGCVGPQVFIVIGAFHFFHVVEATNRHSIRAIRQATQHARHHQTYITGIVRLTEGFPLDVLRTVEVVTNVLNGRNFLHRILEEKFRAGRADKRHVRCGRHF
ncbi:hypothetical protein D3C81_1648720 [compost metagenome]